MQLKIKLFAISILLFSGLIKSQQILKVAVFAPVYIDSAFNENNYKLSLNNLPKNMLPGLDFYNGVMAATDSLQVVGKNVEVLFYDSKGKESISNIIKKPEFENVNLIIASFNNKNDIKPLADFALQNKIPLISATYPNDGGVIANPYFVLLNTSIKTHIEQIYKYLQQKYSTSNVVYVTKKGQMENTLKFYFDETGRNTFSIPVNYKTIDISEASTPDVIYSYLDSSKPNTIICGSLNEAFGLNLVKTLASNTVFKCTIIGMPTWDGLKELDEYNTNGIDIIYTTPYNFVRSTSLYVNLLKDYKNLFNGRPSDMFFKGFESMYHFSRLLIENPESIMAHLSDKSFKLFNDFDIQPLKNKVDGRFQYLENKKLYFIKKK